MLAIFIEGKEKPVLAARVSCNPKKGLQFEDESGKRFFVQPETITNVVFHYDVQQQKQESA